MNQSRGKVIQLGLWSSLLILAGLLASCRTFREDYAAHGMNMSLLGSGGAKTIVLEIDYLPGIQPNRKAVEKVRGELEEWTGKPVAVEWGEEVTAPAPETWVYPIAAVREIFEQHATPPEPDEHRIYVLYGSRSDDYFGFGWSPRDWGGAENQSVVLLLDEQIEKSSKLWLSKQSVESSVLLHEVGHVCGLVCAGDHMAIDYAHCTKPGCRMYHGLDAKSGMVVGPQVVLTGRIPLRLCRWCKRDLKLARQQ